MLSRACDIENDQLLYRLALTRIRGIGVVQTKKLVNHFGDAAGVFCASMAGLLAAGLTEKAAEGIMAFDGHEKLAAELDELRKKSVRMLFFTDPAYPQRLLAFGDAPPLLYYTGNADLNAKKIVAVIGTRVPDKYYVHLTAQLISRLSSTGVLVISGLALGIDAAAHKAAMDNGLSTVGVLGHGLGTGIYPPQNARLSLDMLKQGGLLTFFDYHQRAERYNFPARNRLVAGLCDALLVVQTGRGGGSMLTAAFAKGYGKKIFAVPGRPSDRQSMGCNWLIQNGDAQLLSSGEQLAAAMGWAWPEGGTGVQASLAFGSVVSRGSHDDDPMEERLLRLIAEKDGPGIDELAVCSGLDASTVAFLLLRLELRGSVIALPGKRFMRTSCPEEKQPGAGSGV